MDCRSPWGRKKPKLLYAEALDETGYTEEKHRHEYTEILFVARGSGKLLTERETYPLKRGDLVLMNRGTLHAVATDERADSAVYAVSIDALRSDDGDILKNKNFCIVPSGDACDALGAYFAQTVIEATSTAPYAEAVRERLVQLILLYTLRLAEHDLDPVFNKTGAFVEAKDYFDRHYTENETLEEICDKLFVNRYYLTHVFKQETGMPPVKYITMKRLALAEQILSSSDTDIGVIAKQCGFGDATYFCRVFKKAHGITPLQYRYNAKLHP